jgi:hypothetical protein
VHNQVANTFVTFRHAVFLCPVQKFWISNFCTVVTNGPNLRVNEQDAVE